MHELFYPALIIMSVLIIIFSTLVSIRIGSESAGKGIYLVGAVFSGIFAGLLYLLFSIIGQLKIMAAGSIIFGTIIFTLWMIEIYKKSTNRKFYVFLSMFLLGILYITILCRFDEYLPYIRLNPFTSGFGMPELRHFMLNVILFVPFGTLMGFTGALKENEYNPCFSGFLLSAIIELIQFLFMIGECDLMDVTGNGFGTLIGLFAAYKICIPVFSKMFGIEAEEIRPKKREIMKDLE